MIDAVTELGNGRVMAVTNRVGARVPPFAQSLSLRNKEILLK